METERGTTLTSTPEAAPSIAQRVSGLVALLFLVLFSALVAGVPKKDNITQFSSGTSTISGGDTAYMIFSSVLVMLMTPGLGFFYGGMVPNKHLITTLMQSFICLGVITVLWIVYGYSLVFGEDCGSVIGNPHTFYFYRNVGADPYFLAPAIPATVFSMFQLFFAVITPALISGTFSDRVKFTSYIVFVVFWFTLVYCPLAHILWHPEGRLRSWGVLDFAGGAVVHMSSGWTALVGSYIVGPGKDTSTRKPANVPLVILGTAMLWFGWFGFNPGSEFAADAITGNVFVTTNASAASSMLSWMLADMALGKKLSAVSACCGAVVGLVVITPACAFVSVGSALCMGVMGGLFCYFVSLMFKRMDNVDDALDVFPCHGAGGTIGMFLTACFADSKIFPALEGAFQGGQELVWRHTVSIILLICYTVFVSFIIFKGVDMTLGLRVPEHYERQGQDKFQHGETASRSVDLSKFPSFIKHQL